MRALSKFTVASIILIVFLAAMLWTNAVMNRVLQQQMIESVDYAGKAPEVIYRQLKEIIKINSAGKVEYAEVTRKIEQCNNFDWEHVNLEKLTAKQLIDYFLWTNRTSCRIVNDFGGKMLGRKSKVAYDAHKAVCLDRTVAPVPDRCLVYSFGINFDWTFDSDMELYGCSVLSFDPSMKIENQTRSALIDFYRMGLSDKDHHDDPRWPNVPMLTLNSFYNLFKPVHGEKIIDYLKVDVEGAEWTVVPQLLRTGILDKVRQISIEFHLQADDTLERLRFRAGTIRSLEKYGMVRFDCKPNLHSIANMTNFGFKAFDNYEIAFYNMKHFRHDVDIDSSL